MEIHLNDDTEYLKLFKYYLKKNDIILLKSKLIFNYVYYIKNTINLFHKIIDNLLPIKTSLLYIEIKNRIEKLKYEIDLVKKTDDSIIIESSYSFLIDYSKTIKNVYKSFILNNDKFTLNDDVDKILNLLKKININDKNIKNNIFTSKEKHFFDIKENLKKKLEDNNLDLKENIITYIINNKKHNKNDVNLIVSALIESLNDNKKILKKDLILNFIYEKIKVNDIILYSKDNVTVTQIKIIIDKMINDIYEILNHDETNLGINIKKNVEILNLTFNLNVNADELLELIYNYCDVLIFYKKLIINDLKNMIKSINNLLIISERYNDIELYV